MPILRQGRKNANRAIVALDKHLRQGRRKPKVPVDLERRVGAESAVVHASAQQIGFSVRIHRPQEHAYDSLGVLRITQTRPHDHAPYDAPAGTIIATHFERFPSGFLQARSLRRDTCARMQFVKVGQMAVLWIGFDEFVVPLEDSSISSQSRFSQLGTDGFRFQDQSTVLFVKVFQIVRSLN